MKIKTFIILFILLFILSNILFAEKWITKGPAPGEIYFKAPPITSSGGLTLYHSWDFGETFTIVDSTSQIGLFTADTDSGGIYYSNPSGGLYFSNNYGQNFNLMSGGESYSITSGLIPGVIYKLAMGIRRSEDYGANFIFMGNSPGGQINVGNLPGEIYAIYESQGRLFFSSDSGKNFVLVNDSLAQAAYEWSLRHGSISGELFLLNANTQELFFSNDSGKTFNIQHQFSFQPSYEWTMDVVGSKEIAEVFAIAYRNFPMSLEGEFYIYHSTDYGVTWSSYHHLTTIDDKTSNPIRTFYFSQNYPNPFNGETNIEFYLPTKTNTEITIYDITGKKITTLLNRQLLPGVYNVRWDGTNERGQAVSSGLYFYQLKTSTFSQSKKLLYVR